MKIPSVILLVIFVGAMSAEAQEPTYKNSIGMEFVLVEPGSMQVGVFHPTCININPNTSLGGSRPEIPAGTPPAPGANGPNTPQQGGSNAAAASSGPGRDTQGAGPGRTVPSGGRSPQDPRTIWTEADYKKCEKLVKQDSSDGFLVKIDNPYYIGKYEVTQGEWKKVMGNNPSFFQGSKVTDDAERHPVDNVKWVDTQAFVKRLNAMEKTKLYKLPSEFEWEYACRAGEPGQTSWTEVRKVAGRGIGFGGRAPRPAPPAPSTQMVGSREPNAWGIYDMLGNVWEWVQDPYNDKIFADAVPAKTGSEHVLKGGGFASDEKNEICATHDAGPGDGWDVGFRIVRDVK